MTAIPTPMHEHTTATAIVRWYEKQEQAPRPHLGCSEIGKPCDRALWYSFRWSSARKFDGRMLRLFNTGVREEARFLEELRGIGAEVYDTDPETGAQHRFTAVGGHFAGSCDAIARGLPEAPKAWAVLEFKTHNAKSFAELVKKGVDEHKPEHYAQMQCYMGLAELDRALYLAVNKDTDELYSEWIHFDGAFFEGLIDRAAKIINADEPPPGISTDPAWYQCKWCDHHAVCHGGKVAQRNCRTCVNSTPVADAQWKCAAQDRTIGYDEQRLGCRSHLYIPPLVPFAEPMDAGADWIKYQIKGGGTVFANVTEDADRSEENMPSDILSCYTSAELEVTVAKIVADAEVAKIKQAFPEGRVISSELTDEDIPF